MTSDSPRDFGPLGRILGLAVIGLVLVAILVPVGALTFSVRVEGTSMAPTLVPGDRLLVNFLGRDDVRRFDVVEVDLPDGQQIVKRVIGIPGDEIIVRNDGKQPVVLVTPAGESTQQRVDSPAWSAQWGDRAGQVCCSATGTTSTQPTALTIPADQYWVIGDNWGGSDDSRVYGLVKAEDIGAILNRRIQPFDRMGKVDNPASLVPAS